MPRQSMRLWISHWEFGAVAVGSAMTEGKWGKHLASTPSGWCHRRIGDGAETL